jgi:acetyl-CoA carboxylase biotin carboxyl carrier protein
MTLRYDEIAAILKLIDGSSCDEISIETAEIKLFVRRTAGGSSPPAGAESTLVRAAVPTAPPPVQPQASPPAAKTIVLAPGQFEITAPMVGTFYRTPSPDAPPFVEVGSVVSKGQSLCLIEVMKLFTTIHAERAGRIVSIGPNNGDLVEFGQTLFVLEPSD